MFDIEYVKERCKKRRMYFQAMKSYCILQRRINIKKLKELKYRGQDYCMRDNICELIEIYADILII